MQFPSKYNVTVPVGFEPPDIVAVIVVLVPRPKELGDADTDREGDARGTDSDVFPETPAQVMTG
jgi:hypothetical protein